MNEWELVATYMDGREVIFLHKLLDHNAYNSRFPHIIWELTNPSIGGLPLEGLKQVVFRRVK